MKKIILISLFIVLAFSIKAQETFITVAPQDPIPVGESFQVQYIIEDGDQVSNFKHGSFKNFRIVAGPNIYTGSVTEKSQVKQLKNLVYTLAAVKPGRFIIEGATITVNGKQEKSNDVVVGILTKEEAARRFNKTTPVINSDYFLLPGEDAYEKIRKNLFLKMTVNKKDCFVGEPILATFKLYSRLESRSDIIKNPGFYGFTVYDMINLSDKELATEYVKGKLFDVHTIRKVQLYPLREGAYTIDAMDVKNVVEFSHSIVHKKTEQEIVEGMLRNDSNEVKGKDAEIFESNISTDPVVINVKPTPAKSKPAAYNGATGRFNISASVIKDTMAKNEEGHLEITISGKGNFIQLNAPVVEWPEGIEGFEPVIKDILDKTQTPLSGSRKFSYSFVSAKPGNYVIPSISFSFFDIDSGKYKIVTAPAMQINVNSKELLNRTKAELSDKKSSKNKNYWVIGAAMLLLSMTGVYFFVWKRERKPGPKLDETTGIKPALSIDEIFPFSLLSESVNSRDFFSSLHQSIWKFFNHYFDLSGSEMNKNILSEKLLEAGISEHLIIDTLQVLQQCETGMFTNVNLLNNNQEIFLKTRELFGEIDAMLVSSSGLN
ncbi:MAG: protein BatD [Bacteroidia bacterium]|nr:protein BatD [Bacteroidia bacterium]